jgi:hypothetical protein
MYIRRGDEIHVTHTAGYRLLEHRKCADILKEIKVDTVENKLAQYKQIKSRSQDGRH